MDLKNVTATFAAASRALLILSHTFWKKLAMKSSLRPETKESQHQKYVNCKRNVSQLLGSEWQGMREAYRLTLMHVEFYIPLGYGMFHALIIGAGAQISAESPEVTQSH
jgi:hypothetical protein